MSDDELRGLDDHVAARRREVEDRLARVRESLARETGLSPDRRGWLLALLAASAGLAAALKLGKRRRRRRLSGAAAKGSDGRRSAGRRRRRRRRVSPPRDA